MRQRDVAVIEMEDIVIYVCVQSGWFKMHGAAQRRESVLLLSVISHWSAGGTMDIQATRHSYRQSNLSTWTFTLIVIKKDDDNNPAWLYTINDTRNFEVHMFYRSYPRAMSLWTTGFYRVFPGFWFAEKRYSLIVLLRLSLPISSVVCDIGPFLLW